MSIDPSTRQRMTGRIIIVGLTGGIGSGKTTVAEIFGELGAHVIDWDELARQAVQPGREAWERIVEYFGPDVLMEDSTIDRQRVSDIVFKDAQKRELLNRIVHPAVYREDERLTQEIRERDPKAIIVKDVPLLIEEKIADRFDKVIVVYASEDTRLRRLAGRGVSREEALRRIKAQMPLEEKVKLADLVIRNDGSMSETRKQIEEIYASLRGEVESGGK